MADSKEKGMRCLVGECAIIFYSVIPWQQDFAVGTRSKLYTLKML